MAQGGHPHQLRIGTCARIPPRPGGTTPLPAHPEAGHPTPPEQVPLHPYAPPGPRPSLHLHLRMPAVPPPLDDPSPASAQVPSLKLLSGHGTEFVDFLRRRIRKQAQNKVPKMATDHLNRTPLPRTVFPWNAAP